MQKFEQFVNRINLALISIIIFSTPLFFLPVTRDFLIYSKVYYFLYAAIALLIVSFIKLIITKKIYWRNNPLLQPLFIILVAIALSTFFISPNRIQALIHPHFGLLVISSFFVFYLIAHSTFLHNKKTSVIFLLTLSGFISAIISLIFLINPFKNVNVPLELAFLKNPYFNTVGNQVDFLSFLLFSCVAGGIYIWKIKQDKTKGNNSQDSIIMYGIFLVFTALALLSQTFIITKSLLSEGGQLILPPLMQSWYAALEVLKNPLTAIFGIGIDNFSAVFTKVKDVRYNLSDLWQITTFQSSRSTFLHVLTETGLLGLTGFIFLFSRIGKHIKRIHLEYKLLFGISVFLLAIFPPSFMLWFLFFVSLVLITINISTNHAEVYEVDFGQIIPVFIGILSIYILLIAGSSYFVTKTLISEIYFKKSIDAIAQNNLTNLYENQRQAINYNDRNEDFHINFSQTNLLLANRFASKKKESITDADRKTIAEAIQTAIAEAKTAMILNPQDISNWQNLANVYKSIINVAQGSELWTVSAYQEAIKVDPQNPVLRLELGGIYYLYGNYDNAQALFETAVTLKPDWANAHYNLAWTYFQKKQYEAAVAQMEMVLRYTDPKKSETDYKKAVKDLEEFKKALPQQTEQNPTDQTGQPNNLNLPSPPAATVEPRISLPTESSPAATTR